MTERQVEVHRDIAAGADEVWRMIADVTRMGEWSPETTSCEWVKGATGPVVGARFRGRNRNGGRRWSTLCTVTRADEGRSFVFEVTAGPLKVAEWGYLIDPTPEGCRVTERWVDRRGFLATIGGKPASGVSDRASHNRVTMAQTLEALAEAAERRVSEG